MGLRMTWIAVRGGDEARLLRQFGLKPYGHASEEGSVKFALGDLGDGWRVLTAFKEDIAKDEAVADLAQAYDELLAASIVENVGYSKVEAYAAGKKVWAIVYDCEKDAEGVAVEGRPPSELSSIIERCDSRRVADPEVMFHFDAPIQVAKLVCGYEAIQRDDIQWQALIPIEEAKDLPAVSSMPEAIRIELLPFLEARGWKVGPKRMFVRPDDITRKIGPFTQSIAFWFVSGKETELTVRFREIDTKSGGKTYYEFCGVEHEADRRPIWKRWLGVDKPALPTDPIAAAIDKAREDILRAEAYLSGEQRDPRIRTYGANGRREEVPT